MTNIQIPLPPADFLGNMLVNKPAVATKALPILKNLASSPIPPNLKIPLLIIGATAVAGAILYSWSQQQQDKLHEKAAEKHNAANPVSTTGTKCWKVDFHNLANVTGTGYECLNTLEIIPSSTVAGKVALRRNGIDASPSTTCHQIAISVVLYNSSQSAPSTQYGNCDSCWMPAQGPPTWEQLSIPQKEAALEQLSHSDIEDVLKNAEPSRIPEGTIIDSPVVFTGDEFHDNPEKQEPFTEPFATDNPFVIESPAVSIPIAEGLPDFVIKPATINNPIENYDPSNSQPITIPLSPTSSVTFRPGPDGKVEISQYGTPTKPAPAPTIANPTNKDLHDQLRDLQDKLKILPIATAIGLAPALVQRPTAQSGNASIPNMETAVCNTMKSGGCGDNAIKKNTDALGQTLGNKIDAINSAGQTALLTKIDLKLGNQLTGGVGGQLLRNVTFAGVDRVVNLITLAASVHNAMMLSNNIAQSLFSAIDNILAIPQLIVNPNAETVNSQDAVTKYLDNYFKALFGATEWQAIKAQWKTYSTIYSSTAQAFDNTRSLISDTQELMNQARNFTAELGNAMVDEGMIGEDNWNYKNPKQKVRSSVFGKLEALDNTVQAIESVTSNLRNIVETANEIKENITAIDKAINDANKAAKADRDAEVEGLELPNFSLDDLF